MLEFPTALIPRTDRLGTGAFLDGLRVIDAGTLLTAFAIGVATTVFSAWRWCLVARGVGLRLSLRGAIADYIIQRSRTEQLVG